MKKRLILCMAGLSLVVALDAQTATNLQVLDTRDENAGPVSYSHEVKFEFKNRINMGIPGAGAWSGMMTLAPWFSGDNSGNRHHQLNFNDGGIFYRTGLPASSTWESWRKLILADANDNLMIPGVYNLEQVKLGQYGNGKCGLELINHSGLTTSYGIRLYTSGDSENGNIGMFGLQIQTANPAGTYEELSYATRLAISINGNVGIGTSIPNAQLEINSSTSDRGLIVGANGKSTKIYLHVSNGDYGYLGLGGNTVLRGNGQPSYFEGSVEVASTIHAKEVKVDLTGWSDFVFHPAYKLKPLTEVEQYIKTNGHLENIPSAKEVEQNGVSVGVIEAKLLEKVEQLTLYSIEQDKAKAKLEVKVEEQNKQLQEQRQSSTDLQQQLAAQSKQIEQLKQLITQKLKP